MESHRTAASNFNRPPPPQDYDECIRFLYQVSKSLQSQDFRAAEDMGEAQFLENVAKYSIPTRTAASYFAHKHTPSALALQFGSPKRPEDEAASMSSSPLLPWPSEPTFMHQEFQRVARSPTERDKIIAIRICDITPCCYSKFTFEQMTDAQRQHPAFAGQIVSEMALKSNLHILPTILHLFGISLYGISGEMYGKSKYTSRLFFENEELREAAAFLMQDRMFITHDENDCTCILAYTRPGSAPEDGKKREQYRSKIPEPQRSFRFDHPRSRDEQASLTKWSFQQYRRDHFKVNHSRHASTISRSSYGGDQQQYAGHQRYKSAPVRQQQQHLTQNALQNLNYVDGFHNNNPTFEQQQMPPASFPQQQQHQQQRPPAPTVSFPQAPGTAPTHAGAFVHAHQQHQHHHQQQSYHQHTSHHQHQQQQQQRPHLATLTFQGQSLQVPADDPNAQALLEALKQHLLLQQHQQQQQHHHQSQGGVLVDEDTAYHHHEGGEDDGGVDIHPDQNQDDDDE